MSQRLTPENYLPSDEALLEIVGQRPGITLREIATRVWSIPWDEIRLEEFTLSNPLRADAPAHERTQQMTGAEWLRRRLQRLILEADALRSAGWRGTSTDLEGGVAFRLKDAEPPRRLRRGGKRSPFHRR